MAMAAFWLISALAAPFLLQTRLDRIAGLAVQEKLQRVPVELCLITDHAACDTMTQITEAVAHCKSCP